MKNDGVKMIVKNDTHDRQPNKRKRIWPKVLIGFGVTLILIISGVLIFNKPLMHAYVNIHSKPQTYLKVTSAEMKKNAEKAKTEGNFDSDSAVPVSAENIAKAILANKSRPVIGGIAVPELGINLPILYDSGDYSMLYGAGPLVPGLQMGKGNYVLASHDMWTNVSYYSKTLLFSPLKQAQNGQNIYLTDKDKVYHYKIYDIRQITPDAWGDAVNEIPGRKVVTLITCDTNDAYRILVRGELKDVKPFNDNTAQPFTAESNSYAK